MIDADRLKLVAGLGPLRLLFDIDQLQEVCAAGELAWLPGGGAVRLRESEVPVHDLAVRFGVPVVARSVRHVLIFHDPDRPWGLLVDDIVGVFPAESFILHEVPALLRNPDQDYRRLAVYQGQVLLCCDGIRLAEQ